MTAQTYHFMPGDIFLFVIGKGCAMPLQELINPSEMTDRAFAGGILRQISGSLNLTNDCKEE
jgi:hypothetical protein